MDSSVSGQLAAPVRRTLDICTAPVSGACGCMLDSRRCCGNGRNRHGHPTSVAFAGTMWYESPFEGIAACTDPTDGNEVGRAVLDTTVKGAGGVRLGLLRYACDTGNKLGTLPAEAEQALADPLCPAPLRSVCAACTACQGG